MELVTLISWVDGRRDKERNYVCVHLGTQPVWPFLEKKPVASCFHAAGEHLHGRACVGSQKGAWLRSSVSFTPAGSPPTPCSRGWRSAPLWPAALGSAGRVALEAARRVMAGEGTCYLLDLLASQPPFTLAMVFPPCRPRWLTLVSSISQTPRSGLTACS